MTVRHSLKVVFRAAQEYQAVSEVMKASTPFKLVKSFVHSTLVPSLLLICVPNLMILLCFTAVHLDGSFLRVAGHFREVSTLCPVCAHSRGNTALPSFSLQHGGLLRGMMNIWQRTTVLSPFSVGLLFSFLLWGLLCTKFFKGRQVRQCSALTASVSSSACNRRL